MPDAEAEETTAEVEETTGEVEETTADFGSALTMEGAWLLKADGHLKGRYREEVFESNWLPVEEPTKEGSPLGLKRTEDVRLYNFVLIL